MNMNTLITNQQFHEDSDPEYIRLTREVDELREVFADLLMQRDDLEKIICPRLRNEYAVKIGALEYQVYQYYCMALRIKRKMDLIQQKLNRREEPDLSQIDLQLDKELEEYEEKLDGRFKKYARDLEEELSGVKNAMDEQDRREEDPDRAKAIKEIYRRIVKQIHPDVCKNPTRQTEELFHRAQDAYERGDLEELERIEEILKNGGAEKGDGGSSSAAHKKESLDELRLRKRVLLRQIRSLQEEIEEIRGSFPYNMKDFLLDENAVKARQKELRATIEEYKELVRKLEKRLEEMLAGIGK